MAGGARSQQQSKDFPLFSVIQVLSPKSLTHTC